MLTCVVASFPQVFPGQGPQDFNRTFMGGITNATAAYGQFLDNFMGVGGTGRDNVRGPG